MASFLQLSVFCQFFPFFCIFTSCFKEYLNNPLQNLQYIMFIPDYGEIKAIKQLNIDTVIRKYLRNPPESIMNQSQVKQLIGKASDVFRSQSTLLQIGTDIKIIGDLHGHLDDLQTIIRYAGDPQQTNYIFLGNYVDYGHQSVQTICLLFAYKVRYPQTFFMLRGTHETEDLNYHFGFFQECQKKYSKQVWSLFNEAFSYMPLAAIIGDKVFCVHGGLSPQLVDCNDIAYIERPLTIHQKNEIPYDLLWSDSDVFTTYWEKSPKNRSCNFGSQILQRFLVQNFLAIMIKGGSVLQKGFEFLYDKRLIKLFSCKDIQPHVKNDGAFLTVDHTFNISLEMITSKSNSSE